MRTSASLICIVIRVNLHGEKGNHIYDADHDLQ